MSCCWALEGLAPSFKVGRGGSFTLSAAAAALRAKLSFVAERRSAMRARVHWLVTLSLMRS